jgi:hypothetical protein
MATLRARIAAVYSGNKRLVGRLTFEFVVVFVGLTAAFALESLRRDREEAAYRSGIIAALVPTLDDVLRHNRAFEDEVQSKLAAFDHAIARRERPGLPIFRGSERPPVRIWDSVVATGAARVLPPELLFRLAQFYNRQDSSGERYVRYATYTEQRIFSLGSDRSNFYDASGALRPEFGAYVDRLRELLEVNRKLTAQARDLRQELIKRGR